MPQTRSGFIAIWFRADKLAIAQAWSSSGQVVYLRYFTSILTWLSKQSTHNMRSTHIYWVSDGTWYQVQLWQTHPTGVYFRFYHFGLSSSMNLNTISENASRLGMRIQESFSEHTRDLAIRGSAGIFDTPDEKVKNIRKQLDSSSDREKLDAMKRLIAVSNCSPLLLWSIYWVSVVRWDTVD